MTVDIEQYTLTIMSLKELDVLICNNKIGFYDTQGLRNKSDFNLKEFLDNVSQNRNPSNTKLFLTNSMDSHIWRKLREIVEGLLIRLLNDDSVTYVVTNSILTDSDQIDNAFATNNKIKYACFIINIIKNKSE